MARILGIDIEKRGLRGVLVRTAFRKVEVERYIYVPLAETSDQESRARDLAAAMAELGKSIGQPASIVASIDGQAVSLRQVSLPAAAAKRLADVLPFELESLLPFDVDDALIDHQPCGERGGQLDLLVAAVVTSRMEEELGKLTAAGIQPRQLVPGAVGLEGLTVLDPEPQSGADQPGPLLVLELRRATTELCVTVGKTCRTARTLSIGVNGLPNDGDALIRSIQQTLAGFRASGGVSPERCTLIGEGAFSDGMERWLSDRLEIPVSAATLPKAVAGADPDPAFGRAFSLAARATRPGKHINLRSGKFAPTETKGALVQQANLATSCLIAVLIAAMYSMWSRQELLLDEQRALTQQLAQTTKAVFGRSATTVTAATKLMKKTDRGDPLPRFDAFDALGALSGSIGPDIKHDVRRLRIEVADDKRDGQMELQGSLATIEQRDAIIATLEKHPCFADIEAGRTTPARGNEGINYQLEAALHCPGDVGGAKKRKKKK